MPLLALLFAFVGCATGSGGDACTRSADCDGVCVNGRCTPELDAARPDADAEDTDVGIDSGVLRDGSTDTIDGGNRDAGGDAAVPDSGVVVADVPTGPCAAGCIGSVLRDGASAWTPMPVDVESAFAPPTAVVAAFDIETLDVAYVLTRTTFHLLRLSDGTYIASGSLGTRFPGLTGLVLNATSIPAGHAGGDPNREGIAFAMADEVLVYDYDLTTERFILSGAVTYGEDWDSAFAPDRFAILGAWLALENDEGWVPGSPRLSCAAGADAFVVYIGYLAGDQVHLFDAGHCADFVARLPATSFVPFQLPGTPGLMGVGAMFYHQGELWMLNATPR